MGVCNFELRYDGDLLCEESFGMVLPESELELWPTKEGEARAHLQKLGISMFTLSGGRKKWTLRGSNPRPPVCETGALPLS